MQTTSVDLKQVEGILGDSSSLVCAQYREFYDLTFGKPVFSVEQALAGSERYFAKAVVPATILGSECKATLLVLRPGDGTGDEGTYKRTQVTFSKNIAVIGNSARLIPRSKKCISLECMFPLLTLRDGVIYHAFGRLDEFLIDPDNEIYVGGYVGLPEESFANALTGRESPAPGVWLTTGKNHEGRFGDPHAIVNRTDYTQVVGFVALKDDEENEGLRKLLTECESLVITAKS